MDHIPDDLLELQARFDQWRANRKFFSYLSPSSGHECSADSLS
jgi:hypothetical protein